MRDNAISTFIMLCLLFIMLRGCNVSINQRDLLTGETTSSFSFTLDFNEEPDIDN